MKNCVTRLAQLETAERGGRSARGDAAMMILAIALNTSREAIRNKVLYSILLFACLVTAISAAFGSASIGDTSKFVKDFSLFSISLFGVVTTVVLGVTLLHKELVKRTIYNILSKPVARWEFLLGKFLGLLATLAIMMLLMTAALLLLLWFLEHRIDWELLPVIGAMMLELAVLLAVAIFFLLNRRHSDAGRVVYCWDVHCRPLVGGAGVLLQTPSSRLPCDTSSRCSTLRCRTSTGCTWQTKLYPARPFRLPITCTLPCTRWGTLRSCCCSASLIFRRREFL